VRAIKLVALLLALSLARPAVAQPAPRQEVTLNMFGQGEPDTLDPSRDSATGAGSVIRQVFEPLLRFDDKLVPRPAAAESYSVSSDRTVYTFNLRHDGRWSDGQPVHAQQFEFSWKRILDPQLAAEYAPLFVAAGIVGAEGYSSGKVASAARVGIRALDDFTLEIDLNQPFGALPDLAALWVVPPLRPEIVSADPDSWADDPSTFIGNGPFMVADWVHQDHLSLVPNPRYAAHLNWPTPALTRATITMQTSTDADLVAFQNGERDWMPVADADVNRVLNDPRLSGLSRQYADLTTYWLEYNTARPPLNDVNVRRALARSIDRSALIHELATDVGVPVTSILPPGMPGFDDDLGRDLRFDPVAARASLAEAGFANGQGWPDVSYSFAASASGLRRAEFLHAQWLANLGIEVRLNGTDSQTFQQAFDARDYDLAFGGWAADYPDAQDWLTPLFSCRGANNKFNFCDPTLDQVLARADGAFGSDDRLARYRQAQILLLQALPIAPLYARGHLALVQPWVQSTDGSPLPISALDDFPGSFFLDRVQILPHHGRDP
jgi:oligopeptide transport system substrate-binding protein